ncbi:ubiquitin domain-containing protein 7SL RNA1-like protein [Tanacetum coccineum]
MDLFFDPDKGMSFTIEVGYFDTIKEIKEKVSKYQGIPVYEQTLKFDGKPLPDDLNIHTSDILDGSHLKLITATDTNTTDPQEQQPQTTTTATKVKTEDAPSPTLCPPASQKIKILLKTFGIVIEMDMNDAILKMKEKINEMEGIPLSRIVVYANGIELHDHKSLHESELVDGSEVDIKLKPPTPTPTTPTRIPTPTTTPMPTTPPMPATPTMTLSPTAAALCSLSMSLMGNYPKKLKVNVLSKGGEKIMLEVNPMSNVGDLRNELQKVRNQGLGFGLPEEGYFFIYKQNVMEEDQSFRWHRVAQGDTIEIFNGCVTGGS